jgi:hypothetical protein
MFYFNPIFEATILAVGDPGVANKERIILRPTQSVNLGQFGMAVCIRSAENPNVVLPVNDNFFWFPSIDVTTPCWLFLYTGKGTYEQTTLAGSSETAHVFHWGKDSTIFNYLELVPVLFRQSAILIGPNPDKPPFPKLPTLPPVDLTSPLASLPPFRG